MHGLWRPFKGNFDPAALYAPQPWAARKLLDWISALARSSGSLTLDLLPLSSDWLVSVKELAAFSMRVTVSADAARAHRAEDRRGLGGYFHGFCFHFALIPFAMELLAIGILELLALIFAVFSLSTISFQAMPWLISRQILSPPPSLWSTRLLAQLRDSWP